MGDYPKLILESRMVIDLLPEGTTWKQRTILSKRTRGYHGNAK